MPKVLLIGWDGAGWDRIHPLLDSGSMPNLGRLVENGVMGELRTLTPLCSPLLWTSVATGQYADRHGIFDVAEPDPVTAGVRPVTRASLRCRHVWDLLAHEAIRCHVVGWPATHPATGPATCVSDGFAYRVPDSIHPPELESTLLPVRFEPQEWTGNELCLFVPELAQIDQDKDKRLARLAIILAEAVSVHAAATMLLESEDWDLSAVWFGAVGRATEVFPAGTEEIYRDVVTGAYRLLDLFLGRLMHLAGPDAVVMLVSDRTAGEPEWRGSNGAGPSGVLCAAGPGIQADKLTFGAGLLDIAPTVLALFGFAPASGMAGQALAEICPIAPVRTLRQGGCTPAANPVADLPDLKALEDFGYVDSIAASWRAEADAARARRDFNLARVLLAQGRAGEAIPLLERLVADHPSVTETQVYLGHAYFQCARYEACSAICEELVAKNPESPFAPVGRAHLTLASGNYVEALAELESSRNTYGIIATLDAVVGEAYLKMGQAEDAAAAFRSAIATDPGLAAAHEGLARSLLVLGHYSAAAESALDAVRLRYDFPSAHEILGRALRALGREKEAAEAFAAYEALSRRIPVS